MSQDNELRRLEQFVEKLLARFSELRTEKAKLLQELREREQQIEELRSNLSSQDSNGAKSVSASIRLSNRSKNGKWVWR